MKTIWKLQDAKSQFSRLVKEALTRGPQYVTRRGEETVVIISIDDYNKLISNKSDFKNFILNCPKMDNDFVIDRNKDIPRSVDF
jgi:prevent-host-death family protein